MWCLFPPIGMCFLACKHFLVADTFMTKARFYRFFLHQTQSKRDGNVHKVWRTLFIVSPVLDAPSNQEVGREIFEARTHTDTHIQISCFYREITCRRFRRGSHMTQFPPKWQAFVFCAASHRWGNIKLSECLAWNHENVSAVSFKGLDAIKGHDSVHFQIASLEKASIVLHSTVHTDSDRGSWVERNKERKAQSLLITSIWLPHVALV